MSTNLSPLATLRQVLAFTGKPKVLTSEQEARLRVACLDAEEASSSDLECLALVTSRELMDWSLVAYNGKEKLAEILEQQTSQLLDADELTADIAAGMTRQYRLIDHQVQVATAASERLRMVVEAMYRALERGQEVQMESCLKMGQVYLNNYREWLVCYRQERAAMDAFAAALT